MLIRLAYVGAPVILQRAVYYCMTNAALATAPYIDHLEFFAGECAITHAFRRQHKRAVSYELKHGPEQDILDDLGFAHAINLGCQLVDGGSHNTAPVCSSWVPINRHTSGRRCFRPLGHTWRSYVHAANKMVSRTVLFIYLALAKGAFVILEQPLNSLLIRHPRAQELLHTATIFRKLARLQDFGAPSEKGLWLYSTHKFIEDIDLFKKPATNKGPAVETTRCWTNSAGQKKWCGGRDLKASQTYPRGFGEAVAGLVAMYDEDIKRGARELMGNALRAYEIGEVVVDPFRRQRGRARWRDAGMIGVLACLKP